MDTQFTLLATSAALLGFIHTVLGPDHYLPFIAMSKARNWTVSKTMIITFLCGIGHVLSSIILGFSGILLGIGVSKLEFFESFRENIAAWLLIAFGLAYMIYGIRAGIKNKRHTHWHNHEDGPHIHDHNHHSTHIHVHDQKKKNITPWILFTIFIFGPCEVLIPVLMYPAANLNITAAIIISIIFAIITIATMLTIVTVSIYGLKKLNFGPLEKWTHALAGGIIFFSGLGIQLLGL